MTTAPWETVSKLRLSTVGDLTFALPSGGHDTGLAADPGNPQASHRLRHAPENAADVSPEARTEPAQRHDGSRWLARFAWLHPRGGERTAPPHIGPKTGRFSAPPRGRSAPMRRGGSRRVGRAGGLSSSARIFERGDQRRDRGVEQLRRRQLTLFVHRDRKSVV